jgi:hypothetical protein
MGLFAADFAANLRLIRRKLLLQGAYQAGLPVGVCTSHHVTLPCQLVWQEAEVGMLGTIRNLREPTNLIHPRDELVGVKKIV